jgi:uncharacterized protein
MSQVTIEGDFWARCSEVNARQAIFHQWEQLEASGCIENFRIAAGKVEGLREGWFFSDSDAYKWLEAACRIWVAYPDSRLEALIDSFIELLRQALTSDGYLFTYNQIHFPGVRWQNLQIEHELYCHGHLIEAGVSHFEATGQVALLSIAGRAADRIVEDFQGKGAVFTPGHEEIEIALLRLHQVTQDSSTYFEMARQFIEQRGRISAPNFAFSVLQQNNRVGERGKFVEQKKQEYLSAHPDFKPFQLSPGNLSKKRFNSTLRWYISALSGKYFQQHLPVREQTKPVGHAVRFAYLETATAMLAGESGDKTLLKPLEQAWEHMVTRRMYVTGGIGSLPGLEGFGNDYELDPEYAYAETCAALGCLFWNWEMAQLTSEAKYSELFEWQLYNAAAVGMGLEGTTYLYNNPLACRGEVQRRPWYAVPCCPSNISRTWANLGKYLYSSSPGRLMVHQYISSRLEHYRLPGEQSETAFSLKMISGLPWDGRVDITITACDSFNPDAAGNFELLLRWPTWASSKHLKLNGRTVDVDLKNKEKTEKPAMVYDPRPAEFQKLSRVWSPGDLIEINFEMPIRLLQAHPKVKGHKGKKAVTRGPLVYCLEDVDNPDVDIFKTWLDPDSLVPVFDEFMLGGITKIQGKTVDGKSLIFIPYFLWGNRGISQMTVWVNT